MRLKVWGINWNQLLLNMDEGYRIKASLAKRKKKSLILHICCPRAFQKGLFSISKLCLRHILFHFKSHPIFFFLPCLSSHSQRDVRIMPKKTWGTLFDGASQVLLMVENIRANAGDKRDTGSIPGLGRSPGGGHGNPLQYSCLENSLGQRSMMGHSP